MLQAEELGKALDKNLASPEVFEFELVAAILGLAALAVGCCCLTYQILKNRSLLFGSRQSLEERVETIPDDS